MLFIILPQRALLNVAPIMAPLKLPSSTCIKASSPPSPMLFIPITHLENKAPAHSDVAACKDRYDRAKGIWIPLREGIRICQATPLWPSPESFLITASNGSPRKLTDSQPFPIMSISGLYVCPVCTDGFQTEEMYYFHVSLHDRGRSIRC